MERNKKVEKISRFQNEEKWKHEESRWQTSENITLIQLIIVNAVDVFYTTLHNWMAIVSRKEKKKEKRIGTSKSVVHRIRWSRWWHCTRARSISTRARTSHIAVSLHMPHQNRFATKRPRFWTNWALEWTLSFMEHAYMSVKLQHSHIGKRKKKSVYDSKQWVTIFGEKRSFVKILKCISLHLHDGQTKSHIHKHRDVRHYAQF